MHSLFLEGFNIFEFSGGILLGAVSAFIGARWIDPLMEVLYDGIKNNKGVIGKMYKAYSKSLGRLLFLKKRSTHVALKGNQQAHASQKDSSTTKELPEVVYW